MPMKKLIAATALTAFCGAVSANTITFKDLDDFGSGVNLNGKQAYTDTFNIASGDGGAGDVSGYTKTQYNIDSATAEFWFDVDGTKTAYVKVTLDGAVWKEGFSGMNDFEIPESGITGRILEDLQSNGVLTYVVSLSTGTVKSANVKLTSAELQANATTVPDGGTTVALLGLGLTGLGFLARRKA